MSRRKVLTTATAVGVGSAAVSVTEIGLARDSRQATADGSIVVHLVDLASGRLDVFIGTSRIEIKNRDLASQLTEAAKQR